MAIPQTLSEPVVANLKYVVGDSFKRIVRLKEKDAPQNPIDLTGYEAAAQVRAVHLGTILVSFSATVSDAVNGEVTLSLTATETAVLKTQALWDLQIRLTADTENNTHTVIRGQFLPTLDITKPT
jgi:hypothetical protein